MNNSTTNDDSLLYEYKSNSINFGCGYFVEGISFAPTHFNLTYTNYKSTGDQKYFNNADSTITLYEFESTKDNVVFSMSSDFKDIPLEATLSFTMSMDENLTASTDYNSLYLKGLYSLLDRKLLPYASLQYTMFGGDYDKNSLMFNVGTNYYVWANTFVSTNIGVKTYTDNDVTTGYSDYSLLTWRLKISQNF
jgi:hypothetical protein